ncbi:uncharacterized protein Z519_04038 [Cladophialophora bantiana CBS 173.52]|uniref:Asteroid domain-containing protein n=1 Tax=Cladophialophora bantiana (strain ATCC 10958 / CBS 173.52 / CDC B-1940 / NIH 8579) TaxID=1442370 RepID=A0A0D2IFA1_CLAB1|nr:uncharacterized protein Z519_04038 [Cladophialophora bantiana CBS 173.52]KIW95454.1 hypothetical protein Z519_04038 [Cladophialophora bantiana CBS 173.52]
MGIPRLSQDLAPYADHVVLGKPPPASLQAEVTIIKDLIIDGPSLVYWVYNKLLAYRLLNSLAGATLPPAYFQINQALHHLLNDLQAHGVHIQHIFFDGGLPTSKRDVRLERMEKLRQQLETYRKLYSEFPAIATSPDLGDFDKMLWHTPVMSTRKSTLPAPPFMVASVIESLRNTEWGGCVHVVPGEADMFCALAAQQSAHIVAILTNDSDLAVHNLGSNGRVALLYSIENKHRPSYRESYISALSLNPNPIAARLKVSSLLRFSFERFLDSSASLANIQERARDSSRLHRLQNEYMAYAKPFVLNRPETAHPQYYLENMDPRTAEIVSNFDESPHIYFTPLLEDPQRDSSWSYGGNIRLIAYSLLFKTLPVNIVGTSPHMVECARKGRRITSLSVASLKVSELVKQAAELLQLVDTYISSCKQGPIPRNGATLVEWYSLAIHLLQQEKMRLDKATPTPEQALRLLGWPSTTQFSPMAPTRINWDDIHFLANIHAVLYSLRILAQVTGYIWNYIKETPGQKNMTNIPKPAHNDDVSVLISDIHPKLSTMPPIEALFLDIPHIRAKLSDLDLETRTSAIELLKHQLDPDYGNTQGEKSDASEAANVKWPSSIDGEWITTKWKKRKKKQQSNFQRVTTRSANGFDLLSEDPG